MLNTLVLDAIHKTPREILKFIKTVLSKLIPRTNYIMMDIKYHIISYFGRVPDLKWEGNMLIYIFYVILAPREIFFFTSYYKLLLYYTY